MKDGKGVCPKYEILLDFLRLQTYWLGEGSNPSAPTPTHGEYDHLSEKSIDFLYLF
jgi:hypothetical protein